MSEPVTHAEIEDVLTSIRRLVSTNAEVSLSENGTTAQRPAARSNGRLVLTPALRVMPRAEVVLDEEVTEVSPSPIEDLKADFLRDPQPEPPEMPGAQHPQEPRAELSEVAAAPDTKAAAVLQESEIVETTSPDSLVLSAAIEEPVTDARQLYDDLRAASDVVINTPSEPATEPLADATELTPEMAEQASETETLTAKPVQEDAPWRDPSATLYAAASGQAATIDVPETEALSERPTPSARVAAVVRRISEIENAHQAGQAVPGGMHWTDVPNEDDTGALPTKSPEEADWQDTPKPEFSELPTAESDPVDTDQFDAPVLETPADQIQVDADPVASSATIPETASTVLSEATVAAVQGQVREQLNDAVEAAVQNALPASPSAAQLPVDEAFMDEGALRELVAETVRQELQGALGERITRNVRKLVRREIQRALNSQELF